MRFCCVYSTAILCITIRMLPGTAVNGNCVPMGDCDSYGWLSRSMMLQVDTSTLFCRNTTSILLKQALEGKPQIQERWICQLYFDQHNFPWYLGADFNISFSLNVSKNQAESSLYKTVLWMYTVFIEVFLNPAKLLSFLKIFFIDTTKNNTGVTERFTSGQ